MPEHAHFVLIAKSEWAQPLNVKQQTGFWFRRNAPKLNWQASFYDEIIHSHRELKNQVNYIICNPVRRGLVADWKDYEFTSAIGLDLMAFLIELP